MYLHEIDNLLLVELFKTYPTIYLLDVVGNCLKSSRALFKIRNFKQYDTNFIVQFKNQQFQ